MSQLEHVTYEGGNLLSPPKERPLWQHLVFVLLAGMVFLPLAIAAKKSAEARLSDNQPAQVHED